MNSWAKRLSSTVMLLLALICACRLDAQQAHKTAHKPQPNVLTNADVMKMVQSKLPESVVLNAIQSKPSKFSTSANDLIQLQQAGVTEAEMNAMLAVASGHQQASAANSAAAPAGAAPVPAPDASASSAPSNPAATANPAQAAPAAPAPAPSRLPQVTLIAGGSTQELPLEKTQLAQTKTKPTSMASLAGDSALTQAFQVGIGTAATGIATHIPSGVGSSTIQQAGGIFSGMMAKRKPTITYVWGVPNPASTNILQTVSPAFSVDFSRMPGVRPDDYTPAIVKLTPAQNTCRIVGATEGKQDAGSDPTADWQIYSHFLEERVPSHAEKLATGKYKLTPSSELAPGEYAIVLRPVSKSKGFSGGDVARAQGDGLMFDAAWTFQVSETAQ